MSAVIRPRPWALAAFVCVAVAGWWLLAVSPAGGQAVLVVPTDHPTLADAVAAAAPGDVIRVEQGTLELGGPVVINKSLTIEGAKTNWTILAGDGQTLLHVQAPLTIRDLTLWNIDGVNDGLISSESDLTLERVHLWRADTLTSGGAIHHNGGALIVRDSLFESNTAPEGGAIYAVSGSVTIEDSAFRNNSISGAGAGGYDVYSTVPTTIRRSQFEGPQGVAAHPAVVLASGSLHHSSFLAANNPVLVALGAPDPHIDARWNWWGDGIAPATRVGDHVDVDPWIDSLSLTASPVAPFVGSSVLVTVQLRDGNGTAIPGDGLRVRVERSGQHPLAPPGVTLEMSPTAAHSYTGTIVGGDTIEADVRFGPAEARFSNLWGELAVTWSTAPPPPPPPSDPTPPPSLPPLPDGEVYRSAADRMRLLGLVDRPDDRSLKFAIPTRTLVVSAIARLFSLSDSGSTTGFPNPSPTGDEAGGGDGVWAAAYIAAFQSWERFSGLRDGEPLGDQGLPQLTDTEMLQVIARTSSLQVETMEPEQVELLMDIFGLTLGEVLASESNPQAPQPLYTGYLVDHYPGPSDTTSGSQALEEEGGESEPAVQATPGRLVGLLPLQVARADLPDAPTDELALVRLDLPTRTWRHLDAMFTDLPDGRVGVAALITEPGFYLFVHRPLHETALPAGVTALTWRGPDGQAAARALASATGVEALFQLDVSTGEWRFFRPGAPAFVQTLTRLRDREPLMVVAGDDGGAWRLPAW